VIPRTGRTGNLVVGLRIVERLATGIVRRRKSLALLTLAAAVSLFAPIAYYLGKEPPRFRTSATILLEARPDRVPLFQEFSPYRPLPVQLAILRSRSLAEGVLDNLPKASYQDLVDNPYNLDYQLELKNAFRRFTGTEPEVHSPHQRALRELQQARTTFVAKPDKSGIVEIHGEASRPQVAVDIVNTYIEVLLARTRSFNIDDARVSREFLEQQLAEMRRSLQESEEALRGFTSAHGGVKVPERSAATLTQLSQTENALAEAEASRRMVETRLKALKEKLETQKHNAPAPAPAVAAPPPPRVAAPDLQRLRGQLGQLETALLDMRTKYTEEHPRVVLIKDRIAEVQRQLGDVIKETASITPAPGAVPPSERINFAEQVVALESSFHALSAQEEALRKQAAALRQSLGGLSRGEVEYARLTREVDSHRNLYALLSDKLAAARIREQGEMKIVKVIDPAGQPTPALARKRISFLGIALMLASAIGIGLPAGVEWLHRKVETEDDVESVTGLPVLAVVPHVRSRKPVYGGSFLPEGRDLPGDGFMFTEAIRSLRVAIQLAARAEGLRTILVASSFENEGKSTLVLNLGLAFREAGKRVGLADTDFQRPTLHRGMNVHAEAGLTDALHANTSIEQSLAPLGEGMWLAQRGPSFNPRMRGMMATSRMKELVDQLAQHADLVLCDSSPVLLIPESLFLAAAVDGVLLVAKAGSTGCRDLARTKSALEGVGAKILGVVINEMPASALRSYYRRYYNAYVRSDRSDRK
jgi:capsular exopolysaccharide synthesis family protein